CPAAKELPVIADEKLHGHGSPCTAPTVNNFRFKRPVYRIGVPLTGNINFKWRTQKFIRAKFDIPGYNVVATPSHSEGFEIVGGCTVPDNCVVVNLASRSTPIE